MPRQNQIQFRKGTYSQWDAQSSTVLGSGEPGFITNFNKLKIGDGSTQWSDLSAINDALTTLVYNGTASTIPKMSVVYINGAQGDMPSIRLSIASGEMTSSKTYGITTNAISAGGTGMVVVDGALKNLNTSPAFDGVTPGTTLWLSPTVSGGITTTKPSGPNHMVSVGNLIRVHNQQGIINVKIQNGFELEELHNVTVSGVSGGQFLYYNSSSGLWQPNPNIYSVGGSIGIGTNSPYGTLDVYGTIVAGNNTLGRLIIGDDNYGGDLGILINNDEALAIKYNDGSFRYGETYPGASDAIVVSSGKNVGIGTTSPTTKLDIAGTLKVNGDPIVNEGATLEVSQHAIGMSTYNGAINIESSTAGDGTINIGNGFNDTTNINSTFTYINGWTFDGDNVYNNNGILNTNSLYTNSIYSATNNSTIFIQDLMISSEPGFIYMDAGAGHLSISADANVNITSAVTQIINLNGNVTVGGNLTVNGSTFVTNVDTVTIEDPIITLGLASGNIVPFTNSDRGLALVRGTGLTAFMGWDTSASQFVMLSSGVSSNSSGNYDAGTYGNLQINNLNSSRVYSSRLDLNDGINSSFISCGAEGDTRFLVSSNGALGIGSAIPSTIDSAPFYISSNGSVTNGTWNASTIAVNKGGTGRTSYSNGQLLIGSGTSLVANTLTSTSGIGITNGSGTITIGVTGIPSSTITNFNSSVSGLLPTISNSGDNRVLTSTGSTVGVTAESNLTFDGNLLNVTGSGSFSNSLIASGFVRSGGTSSQFLKADGSVDSTSYQSSLTNPVTGTGTNGKIPKWNSTSGLTDSILSESSSVINIAGSFNSTSDDTYLSFDANSRRIGITKKAGSVGKFTYGSGVSFAISQSNISTIEATNTFTDRLVVDASGNVGIGTTTPGYKLQVAGSFGATTKSFRIDHPSKSGWNLEYGSLESPYHGVRLTGRSRIIKGVGTVDLPYYLKDLIHDDTSIIIQLTNYKHGKTLYVDEIDLQNDKFIVKADRAKSLGELEFFWTLTGVRKDVDHLVVEKEN